MNCLYYSEAPFYFILISSAINQYKISNLIKLTNTYLMISEEISTNQSSTLQRPESWNLISKDMLTWIQSHYSQGAKEKIETILNIMYDKMKDNQTGQDSKYFVKLGQYLQKKYYPKRVYYDYKLPDQNKEQPDIDIENECQDQKLNIEEDIVSLDSSKLSVTQNKSYLKRLRYSNFKRILKFLTFHRFRYNNIAKHNFRGRLKKNQKGQGFAFHVQRGINNWYQGKFSVGLLYVFVRDVSKAIIQLQEAEIYHYDINRRNILLYHTINLEVLSELNQEKLMDASSLSKFIDEIVFKIIDFGEALLLSSQNIGNELHMIKVREDIGKNQHIQESDIYCSMINTNPLNNYKQKHSQNFLQCISNFPGSICDIDKEAVEKQISQFDQMIKAREYKQLILKMDDKIKEWKEAIEN